MVGLGTEDLNMYIVVVPTDALGIIQVITEYDWDIFSSFPIYKNV